MVNNQDLIEAIEKTLEDAFQEALDEYKETGFPYKDGVVDGIDIARKRVEDILYQWDEMQTAVSEGKA